MTSSPLFPQEQNEDGELTRQQDELRERHYYMTHDEINPTRIVPLGPVQEFMVAHGRAR